MAGIEKIQAAPFEAGKQIKMDLGGGVFMGEVERAVGEPRAIVEAKAGQFGSGEKRCLRAAELQGIHQNVNVVADVFR